jgi:mannosyl-oligosaccharide glucosidase
MSGSTPTLGDFSIQVTKGPESNQHPISEHPSNPRFDRSIFAGLPLEPEKMWEAKGSLYLYKLIVDTILRWVTEHGHRLIEKWGKENPPPPAYVYSLENRVGAGLQVVQKVFIGDFEVPLSHLKLI